MQYPREKRFNNRRGQRPYPNRQNVNQQLPSSGPSNSNYHGERNPYGTYRDESSSYSKREYHNPEREFFKTNAYQRRQLPYDKRRSNYSRNRDNSFYRNDHNPQPSTSHESESPAMNLPLISPEEIKAINFINVVQSQEGIGSTLVLLQSEKDNMISVLQNAVNSIKNGVMSIVPGTTPQNFELRINGDIVAEGEFANKQAAKSGLCESAMEVLKKICFYIIKKKNYEEISTDNLNTSPTKPSTSSSMEGSKAHLMMLKMGWGGKGLGVNEQGAEKTVAETMTRNITKEGLGGKNVMAEINQILEEFARSAKVTTLAFDSGFTKEERARIHSLAAKFNLRSKSEGQGDDRRITIGKKIAKWDLVKELLLCNCENESYKLLIPSNFQSIWTGE